MKTATRNAFVFLLVAIVALLGATHDASSAFAPTPTGTGYRHVTSGKEDPASVALIPEAAGGTGANLASCNANEWPRINSTGAAMECTGHLTDVQGAADIPGTSTPTIGLLRIGQTGTVPVIEGISGVTNYDLLTYNAGGAAITFGNTAQYAYVNGYGIFLTSQSAAGTYTDGLSGVTSSLGVISLSLSADFTTTIATSTNLNTVFNVTAGEVWSFEWSGTVLNTSGGTKFQITAPATGTVEGWLDSVTTTAILLSRQRYTAINTLNTTATNTGASVPAPTRIFGRLNAVAGGTFGIGVASVTAGQTTTVRAGATLTARRTNPL